MESFFAAHPSQVQQAPQGHEETGPFPLAVLVQSGDKRMIVVGTSHLIRPVLPGLPPSSEAVAFFLNTLDWMMQDAGMISIRTKGSVARPLRNVAPTLREVVKWGNMFGWPLLIAAYGFWRWRRRRAVKSARAVRYV
jgi:ABC-type uncharacterized transport system involved in gliding motility auxiliary subunit